MRIENYFSANRPDWADAVHYRSVAIEICDANPALALCIPSFAAPIHWSDMAVTHLAHHYVRRNGVPARLKPVAEDGVPEWLWRRVADEEALIALPESDRYGAEESVAQIIHRLCGAWTYWGWVHGYFDTVEDARHFYHETGWLILQQRVMPASTQWSQTGLFWAYGIAGDAKGHFYIDAINGELKKAENAYERPQHHHCFIHGVRDALAGEGSISDWWQRDVSILRNGSGSGCNLSSIRGASEPLSSGMPSAGVRPFQDVSMVLPKMFAASQHESESFVRQLMLMNADHPDIEEVLSSCRQQAESMQAQQVGQEMLQRIKAQALQAMTDFCGQDVKRFDPAFNLRLADAVEEALQSGLTHDQVRQMLLEVESWYRQPYGAAKVRRQTPPKRQESVLGMRLPDGFLMAAKTRQGWPLRARRDGALLREIRADHLLQRMMETGWIAQHMSVQFDDAIQRWHPCAQAGAIEASGPNGEFFFLNDSACDVMQLNVGVCVNDAGEVDVTAIEKAVVLMVIASDIAITMAQFPSADVAYNCYRYRPIGLSFCNLSALLLQMGYAYDSAEARANAAAIAALMTGRAYEASAELARELGGFEAYSEHREEMLDVIASHRQALQAAKDGRAHIEFSCLGDDALLNAACDAWERAEVKGQTNGFSNAQVSLIANSPNILRMMDALSSGCEPLRDSAALQHKHRWSDEIETGLKRLGYNTRQISDIRYYVQGHGACEFAPHINHASLQMLGFGWEQLRLIDEALQVQRSFAAAFDPLLFGERFSRQILQLKDDALHDADFNLLGYLGFSAEEIEEAESYCCGRGTLAGAPHLREEDETVFAYHGEDASTLIAQLQMMAAIQPFLSGGIAHQLILPYEQAANAQESLIYEAWQFGLKSLTLVRQSPKRRYASRPADRLHPDLLSAGEEDFYDLVQEEMQTLAADLPEAVPVMGQNPFNDMTPAYQLRPLPDIMQGLVRRLEIQQQRFVLRISEYEDGSPAEVTLEPVDALDESLAAALQQWAMTLSFSLQCAMPLALCAAMPVAPSIRPLTDEVVAELVRLYPLQDVPSAAMQELITEAEAASSVPQAFAL